MKLANTGALGCRRAESQRTDDEPDEVVSPLSPSLPPCYKRSLAAFEYAGASSR